MIDKWWYTAHSSSHVMDWVYNLYYEYFISVKCCGFIPTFTEFLRNSLQIFIIEIRYELLYENSYIENLLLLRGCEGQFVLNKTIFIVAVGIAKLMDKAVRSGKDIKKIQFHSIKEIVISICINLCLRHWRSWYIFLIRW